MSPDRTQGREAGSVRLFVAVDVPEQAGRAIASAIAPLREAFPRARWAPRGNWHVTLKFLGPTPAGLVDEARGIVEAVAGGHAPVATGLAGLGSFPSATRTRVLWVGLDDGAGGLATIAAALDAAFAPRVRPEGRGFTAHLTVARADPPLRLEPTALATPTIADPFTVDRLVLYRSRLGRPAARYEALATVPLTGPD